MYFYFGVIVGLGPGGLDSERIPENERDWDSWVYPDSNHKPLNAPNHQLINHLVKIRNVCHENL